MSLNNFIIATGEENNEMNCDYSYENAFSFQS